MPNHKDFKLSPEMIDYALAQLAQRIGITGVMGLQSFQKQTGLACVYGAQSRTDGESPEIIIQRCPDNAWGDLLSAPAGSLDWVPAEAAAPPGRPLPFSGELPVLFWGAGSQAGARPFARQRPDGRVTFHADILAGAFFMLSRWEEMVTQHRDEHDRFPSTASVAFKQGFLNQPIVDQYALILGAWIQALAPSLALNPPGFAVKLSHDIDRLQSQQPELEDPNGKLGSLGSGKGVDPLPRTPIPQNADLSLAGILELARLADEAGYKSAFYFMTASNGENDQGYYQQVTLLQKVIDQLRSRGHEIGFHPGYQTYNDLETFLVEKGRLDALLEQTHYGGRQHFLRFQVPGTWRLWETAGLAYDSTLGYEYHSGFRCGTCHPYHPYDIPFNRTLQILEIPLVTMGYTFHKMQGASPEHTEEQMLSLAKRCREVNGLFTLLWHNTSFEGAWTPYVEMFTRILQTLKHMRTQP